MLTYRKIATVTGLVGSLAAICVGAQDASAAGRPGDCTVTAQGDTVCIRKTETRTDKDGKHVLRQEQDCSTVDRPRGVLPGENQLLGEGGASRVGPVVDCSNSAKLPKGFKKPHFEF
ncbi:hypothetical protein ACF073_03315 [Streptomyces sp. NPDC015171]|uniref:hypothetical protein n=1 Tax=Streptomyces sp. NPDC015171 TaxID=3364945 RepID=UPI0036F52E63